jgi:hypothetical protein
VPPLLAVDGLVKHFPLRGLGVWLDTLRGRVPPAVRAVDGVTLAIDAGDAWLWASPAVASPRSRGASCARSADADASASTGGADRARREALRRHGATSDGFHLTAS